jgi:hypothetical protein
MKNYALITTTAPKELIREMDAPTNVKAGYKIVPIQRDEQPDYNALTHKLEPKTSITLTKVTYGWNAVALSEGEAKNATYKAAMTAGFDTGMGFSLKLYDNDRTAFTQLLVLVNEAVKAGAMTEASTVDIWDTTSTKHTVTVAQYRMLVLGYGAYFQQITSAKE